MEISYSGRISSLLPHIAGPTGDSMRRGIVAGIAENIRRIERGEEPLNTQWGCHDCSNI